jgi:hypothetical protein
MRLYCVFKKTIEKIRALLVLLYGNSRVRSHAGRGPRDPLPGGFLLSGFWIRRWGGEEGARDEERGGGGAGGGGGRRRRLMPTVADVELGLLGDLWPVSDVVAQQGVGGAASAVGARRAVSGVGGGGAVGEEDGARKKPSDREEEVADVLSRGGGGHWEKKTEEDDGSHSRGSLYFNLKINHEHD